MTDLKNGYKTPVIIMTKQSKFTRIAITDSPTLPSSPGQSSGKPVVNPKASIASSIIRFPEADLPEKVTSLVSSG